MDPLLQNPVEHRHIQNSSYIQNPVKYLLWRNFLRTMRNLKIFKTLTFSESQAYSICCQTYHETFCLKICLTLTYLEPYYIQNSAILKSKYIQSPAEYLRWNILLRTLCNYSIFRGPTYSKLSLIQNQLLTYYYYCIHYLSSKV